MDDYLCMPIGSRIVLPIMQYGTRRHQDFSTGTAAAPFPAEYRQIAAA